MRGPSYNGALANLGCRLAGVPMAAHAARRASSPTVAPTVPSQDDRGLSAPLPLAFRGEGAAFSEIEHPVGRRDEAAPAGSPPPAGAAVTIMLPERVLMVLKLVEAAKGIDTGEAIARAICVFAGTLPIASLLDGQLDEHGDLADLPEFNRAGAPRSNGGDP